MFAFLKNPAAMPSLCCIDIQPQGLAFAHIGRQTSGLPVLQQCEFLHCPDPTALASMLHGFVTRHNLYGTPCSWVLRPENYKLFIEFNKINLIRAG